MYKLGLFRSMQRFLGTHAVRLLKACIVCVTLLGASQQVAALSPPAPHVSVIALDAMGDTTYGTRPTGLPNYFSAAIVWPEGNASYSYDVYFGVLSPDGRHIYSWSVASQYRLTEGLAPLAEGLSLTVKQLDVTSLFSSDALDQGKVALTITDDTPPGMYYVFVLAVIGGYSPAEIGGWLAVRLTPFIVQPRLW